MTHEADGLSFDAIRPWVYRVVDELLDVDPVATQLSAGERHSQRLMAGETAALAILDGGVLIHSTEGAWIESSREEAFAKWVADGEAAGEEWDEDDFEYEPDGDAVDGLSDGVYVVGPLCMRLIAARLAVPTPSGVAEDEPPIEQLEALAAVRWTSTGDPDAQAGVLLERMLSEDWDGLEHLGGDREPRADPSAAFPGPEEET